MAKGALKPCVVGPAALDYALAFAKVAHAQPGDWVVAFDWSTSVSYKNAPDATPVDIGPCLGLGAYRRNEVPASSVEWIGGLEFAVAIPSAVLAASSHRLIDRDDAQFFKLILR